jgi:hypothetical protein
MLVMLAFEQLAVKISQQANGVPAGTVRQRYIKVEDAECARWW